MHHNGLILCGVANGSSPGLSCVVETGQGQGALELALLANKRVTYTSHYPCIHVMQHKTFFMLLIGYSVSRGKVCGHVTWGVVVLDNDRQ